MSFNYPTKPWIDGQKMVNNGTMYEYDSIENCWKFSSINLGKTAYVIASSPAGGVFETSWTDLGVAVSTSFEIVDADGNVITNDSRIAIVYGDDTLRIDFLNIETFPITLYFNL